MNHHRRMQIKRRNAKRRRIRARAAVRGLRHTPFGWHCLTIRVKSSGFKLLDEDPFTTANRECAEYRRSLGIPDIQPGDTFTFHGGPTLLGRYSPTITSARLRIRNNEPLQIFKD